MSYSNRVKETLLNKKERKKCCKLAFISGQSEQDGNFECKNCYKAFFRGLFSAHGSISDPQDAYHLEFILTDEIYAEKIKDILSGANIFLKSVKRRKNYILYLKSSEQIEDFLYYINAEKFSFELMETKILKAVRNDANRSRNFESANLDKMSRASAGQIEAIEHLKSSGKFDKLPKELKQTAELRLDNIELSLKELGEASEPAVTKSAIVHRMKKIMDLANGRY
ncbi:MAG: DNA-binding protein WhiA [Oscillospiraceae bacterium]|nr:DNA-binding protein WhiA [Oscillospiraceae bacterium]